jgi:hypothetical protein
LSDLLTMSKTVHSEEEPFEKLRDDMQAEHTTLLYYCDICWLSRAKLLHRAFELNK